MKFTHHPAGAGLLFLAALLPAFSSSFAATVTAPAVGDLFVAFRASGGQGASTSYIVNIGNDLTYRNAAAGSSIDISVPGNISADLVATYGVNWSSRTDLFWGVFGARQSVSSSVYASKERDTPGSATSAWPALTQTARNATATSVIDVISGINGFTGSESTANSSVAVLQPNASSASSYNFQVSTAGTTDFGSLSQWSSIEGDFGSGASGSVLDIYRIAGSDSTLVGSFSINSSGTLHFTAPVPEPGSVFLTAGAAGLLALRRRRA